MEDAARRPATNASRQSVVPPTHADKTPGPFAYKPKRYGINRMSRGGKMGYCQRRSFIDDAASSDFTPGPGNYQAPSEFGHYRKSRNSLA